MSVLLVLEDYVGKPNSFARDTNNFNTIIPRCIPGKAVIVPLLWFERKVTADIKSWPCTKKAKSQLWREAQLTISIHTLVVRVSSFSFCGMREEAD